MTSKPCLFCQERPLKEKWVVFCTQRCAARYGVVKAQWHDSVYDEMRMILRRAESRCSECDEWPEECECEKVVEACGLEAR